MSVLALFVGLALGMAVAMAFAIAVGRVLGAAEPRPRTTNPRVDAELHREWEWPERQPCDSPHRPDHGPAIARRSLSHERGRHES